MNFYLYLTFCLLNLRNTPETYNHWHTGNEREKQYQGYRKSIGRLFATSGTRLHLARDSAGVLQHLGDLAAVVRLAQRLAFVVAVLALAQGDLELGQAFVVDEHPQRNNRLACVLRCLLQFAQFAAVEQELAVAQHVVVGITAELVLRYMHLFGEELAAYKLAIRVGKARLRLADRLDLRAEQLDPGGVTLQDLVVERRTAVLDIHFTLQTQDYLQLGHDFVIVFAVFTEKTYKVTKRFAHLQIFSYLCAEIS